MTSSSLQAETIPLIIPCSSTTTLGNKTGTWRFVKPLYAPKTAPCSAACPAGEDIPKIEMLITREQPEAAWMAILHENPFPAVCGRVCFHPCENACNRERFDTPIAIHHLERHLGDFGLTEMKGFVPQPLPANGRKVAIMGAGPAGLAAAYFLARLGYTCRVFESAAEPGGLLRWGIPAYRLPGDILRKEIQRITLMGVEITCNHRVSADFIQRAAKEYNALFVSCGLGKSACLNIPGKDLAQDGLEFLRQVRRGDATSVSGSVAVIGGGNTAVDVARTLKRQGARPVIVYRRRRQDMPAFGHELEMALEEGVDLVELAAPVSILIGADGLVLKLQKMKVHGQDGERAGIAPDGDAIFHLNVDRVVMAIGAEPDPQWRLDQEPAALRLSHCVFTPGKVPLVIGGDLTNTILSVTDAIASGKQGAMALDVFFTENQSVITDRLDACRVGPGPALSMESYMELGSERRRRGRHVVAYPELNCDYFESRPRGEQTTLDVSERCTCFAEVETGLPSDAAVLEAARCFNCGICNDCDICRLFCPEMAVIARSGPRRILPEYCKGCGICVQECPRSAMALEEETP